MKQLLSARPLSLALLAAAVVAAFVPVHVFAQDADSLQNKAPLNIAVSESDIRAAANTTAQRLHVTPANRPGTRAIVQMFNEQNAPAVRALSIPSPTPPAFYPADLVYSGGARVTSAQSHAVYVNCTAIATCWGNPEGFLTDLGKSTFIHLIDQYVGSTANGRYTDGVHANVGYSIFGNTLYPHDIFAIVHAVAQQVGTGYGHMYHIFLPQGTDTCFDQSNICYSPDNPNNFRLCGYHGSVTFSDIGHVVYTVEPFQNVGGCSVATPSPNGQLADSTNSLLSHEFFEAATDPDSNAWFNRTSLDLRGFEIADECQPLGNASGFLVPTFFINGKKYEVQAEYSNFYHACAVVP